MDRKYAYGNAPHHILNTTRQRRATARVHTHTDMQTIQLDDIIVPEHRQRIHFDEQAIAELAESISSDIGLLQPIILRDDDKTLVAGERRLRAMRYLVDTLFKADRGMLREAKFHHNGEEVPLGQLPYVRMSQLDEEAFRRAELEENIRREDLTWQERAKAIASLHATIESETFTETAKAIYGDDANKRKVKEVAEAVRLSEFLDDPMVAAAPDEKTARRAIRDTEKWKQRAERISSFSASSSNHKLHLGDAFERAREDLGNTRLDTIVMDPPYGIDANTKGFSFDGAMHEYDDSDAYFQAILTQLPGLCHELCADQAHVYCFCDIRRFSSLFTAFELGGWSVWARPIIWDKGTVGSYAKIELGPRNCYEAILYANKGSKPVQEVGRDVINIAQETDAPHPANKPRGLYSELLKRSVLPGDIVADFFAGSGPIFAAAAEHSCIAYGWEINEKYYEMSLDTIREVTNDADAPQK